MPFKIKQHDMVALTEDLPPHGFVRGQVGTVVEHYAPDALEVEVVDNSGHTYAPVTLKSSQHWFCTISRLNRV